MDAFSEKGPSVTDTLVTTLTKLSTSQEAIDNRLNEMSKQMEERNTSFTNQLATFTKNQTEQSQRCSYSHNRGQNSNYSRGNRGNYRTRYRGNTRGYPGRPNYRGNRGQFYQNSSPRYQLPQNHYNNLSNAQSDKNYNQTQNQNAQFENLGQRNRTFQPQASVEVFFPYPKYMPYTQQSSITCHRCGNPNHPAPNCTLKGPPPRRGTQNPFNQNPKNS